MVFPPFRHPKNSLKNLVARHHALAKGLAQGLTLEQAALLSHYTLPQAERLALDRVFQQLVEYYVGELRDFT